MLSWSMVFLIVMIFVPMSLLLTFIPYLTRKTESFGVSITEEVYHSSEIGKMRKSYAWVMGILCFALITSVFVLTSRLSSDEAWAFAVVSHTLTLIFVSFLVYLKFHLQMKRLKAERNWLDPKQQRVVVSTTFHSEKLAYSPWWFLPHGIVVLMTIATGLLFYDAFPDEIIMQSDLKGNPTNIVDKSYQTVLWPAALQLFIISLHGFIYYTILRSKQQIDAANPEQSLARNVIFRRRWSGFTLLTAFLMVCLFYFIQLSFLLEFSQETMVAVPLAFCGIIVAASFWLSFKTGQGGSRIKTVQKGNQTEEVNMDDDKHWKLGRYYFNPDDPSLFVEKRFGIGWTINFGRPLAWTILIVIIAIPLLLSTIAG